MRKRKRTREVEIRQFERQRQYKCDPENNSGAVDDTSRTYHRDLAHAALRLRQRADEGCRETACCSQGKGSVEDLVEYWLTRQKDRTRERKRGSTETNREIAL